MRNEHIAHRHSLPRTYMVISIGPRRSQPLKFPYLAFMLRILRDIFIYVLLCVATLLMLKGIVRYYPMRDDIGFLRFKQPYLHYPIWKAAFYIHVFSILPVLLAGFTQFSRLILKENKQLHRLVGRIYAYDILLLNAPAGMVLAINANGLLPGRAAFVILDCLWFWFTLKALLEARKGNIAAHRRYMIRSYALTLSAVMLRGWKLIILSFVTVDPLHLYMIDAWLGFVPNLLFAEWLIYRSDHRSKLIKMIKSQHNSATSSTT